MDFFTNMTKKLFLVTSRAGIAFKKKKEAHGNLDYFLIANCRSVLNLDKYRW